MNEGRSVELHWMDNLNENNVQKVLISHEYSWNFPPKELKFVNHCVDRTFDISTLAYSTANCLDFKSNGPISVKSNVSEIFHCKF